MPSNILWGLIVADSADSLVMAVSPKEKLATTLAKIKAAY